MSTISSVAVLGATLALVLGCQTPPEQSGEEKSAQAMIRYDPCDGVFCPFPQVCQAPADRPECVTPTSPTCEVSFGDPCACTACPSGFHCEAPADDPMCVPDPAPICDWWDPSCG
jgi:hypothetical protein